MVLVIVRQNDSRLSANVLNGKPTFIVHSMSNLIVTAPNHHRHHHHYYHHHYHSSPHHHRKSPRTPPTGTQRVRVVYVPVRCYICKETKLRIDIST